MSEKRIPGKLYVVATPIGNSEDMTGRAKRILAEADIVAAEDTRTTQKLLALLGIRNKMVPHHKFNERRQTDYLISELLRHKTVALVSDAGTPCISDPGHHIVSEAAAHGIDVVGVCGASSVMTALSVAGFSVAAFSFHGFLPRENKEMQRVLRGVRESDIPVAVFFESPRRIAKSLGMFVQEMPDADMCLCNDLTKMHERIYRGKPEEILRNLENNPAFEKGEYTLVVQRRVQPKETPVPKVSYEAMLIDHIVKQGGSLRDAVRAMQETHKGTFSRKEFYTAALSLKKLMPCLLSEKENE